MDKAILVVTLSSEVGELCTELRESFPEYTVVSTTLRQADGIKNAMAGFKADGVSKVVVVPIFVMDGEIYARAVDEAKQYSYNISLEILPPIISDNEDFNRLVNLLPTAENTIYCIHKSSFHIETDKPIWQMGDECDELTARLKAENITSVTVQPLMIGLGYHFKKDVVNKLKAELEKADIEVKVVARGLLEYKAVRESIKSNIKQTFLPKPAGLV